MTTATPSAKPGATSAAASATTPANDAAAPAPSLRFVVANAVCFQLCWFACVLGAAHGWAWLGTACVALMLAWHLTQVAAPRQELKLVASALAIGAGFDAVLLGAGAVVYPSGPPALPLGLAGPHWMLALWALFAITLNVSLRWLKRRTLLAVVLGAVVAPMSFWGGARLGAAQFPSLVTALLMLALGWAVAMPFLMWLSLRFDGVAPGGAPQGR